MKRLHQFKIISKFAVNYLKVEKKSLAATRCYCTDMVMVR